jgi:uncharacterized damage-inducible protein DinB
MEFQLDPAIEILGRTPATLGSLLQGLSEGWVLKNEGGDTWSPYDVLGHLIHGEQTDWIPRARIILEHGEARPFEPFNRFAQFDQSNGRSTQALLDEFAALREANINTLRALNLSKEQLAKRGTHPELGVVTLAQLLATWVVHDLDHVGQVARVMSKQYSDAVGPWKEYLGILK